MQGALAANLFSIAIVAVLMLAGGGIALVRGGFRRKGVLMRIAAAVLLCNV
jgi:hypothetical protein